MTFLSVIVPTYNSEKTIERCLNSMVSQTYQDFEICILDGGSQDKTLSEICKFRSTFSNIRIISEPDKGVYDAMNKGIDISRGDWLLFLGSDDEIADKEVFADVFSSSIVRKNKVIYGNTYINDDTAWAKAGQIYDGLFDLRKLLSKNICHQAIFYSKDLFERFGKYKTQYVVCADWEINLRFYSRTQFHYLDRTISIFHGGGLSSEIADDLMACDIEKIRQRTLRECRRHKLISCFGFA